jgi:AraC-like DNA-binding protein
MNWLLQNPLTTATQRLRLASALTSPRAGIVRLALFRHIPDVLAELGADADATIASVGLERADFADPACEIPYTKLEALLLECERRTECDHFGLQLGSRTQLADLGLLANVVRCATTVGEALRALEWTYNLRRGGGIVHLIETGETACFVFGVAAPDTRDTRQYQMAAVTIAFMILRQLFGPDWRPHEVRFALRAPTNLQPFKRAFRAAVQFDAEDSLISFASECLAQPLPPVDEATRRGVAAGLSAMRRQAFADFPVLVRDVIRMQLSMGTCTITSAAAALSLGPRSLERRLSLSGDSYVSLRNSVKHEVAVRLLRESNLSVQEIAAFLCFSSAANFATAFRRWTSVTPSAYRRRVR